MAGLAGKGGHRPTHGRGPCGAARIQPAVAAQIASSMIGAGGPVALASSATTKALLAGSTRHVRFLSMRITP